MLDNEIMEFVERAKGIGRREAYADMFKIASDMYMKDGNDSIKKLIDIIFEKAINNKE